MTSARPMNNTTTPPAGRLDRMTVGALLVAATGIVIQMVSGVDFPAIPPGLVILLVAAGLVFFVPRRWTPIIGALAALSQLFGLFAAGQGPRLLDLDPLGGSIGLWIQLLGVTVASIAGIAAAVRGDRDRVSA